LAFILAHILLKMQLYLNPNLVYNSLVSKKKTTMNAIIKFLSGKKTYIIGTLVFILGGLQALGYDVPSDVFSFLGGLGLITLRSAIVK